MSIPSENLEQMVDSRGLVNNIGGEDDLNSNTTRRVLLLLESHAVANREVYDRVRRADTSPIPRRRPRLDSLCVLNDDEKRSELAKARTHDDLRQSQAWEEVRTVSKPFHDGLVALFLKENDPLRELTMHCGLF